MPKDDDMYGLVCKERFDKMEGMQEETLRILRGKNGDPGLVDEVRALKKANKIIWGGGAFVLCAVVMQTIRIVAQWISGAIK